MPQRHYCETDRDARLKDSMVVNIGPATVSSVWLESRGSEVNIGVIFGIDAISKNREDDVTRLILLWHKTKHILKLARHGWLRWLLLLTVESIFDEWIRSIKSCSLLSEIGTQIAFRTTNGWKGHGRILSSPPCIVLCSCMYTHGWQRIGQLQRNSCTSETAFCYFCTCARYIKYICGRQMSLSKGDNWTHHLLDLLCEQSF